MGTLLLPYKSRPHSQPATHANNSQNRERAPPRLALALRALASFLHSVKMPKAATTKRGGKEVKRRGKKDPNAPKRGLSAYMFFANEQRENVREENPGISFGQVGKLLGERWKALNDKQR